MSKITLTGFALLSFCFSGTAQEIMQRNPKQKSSDAPTGTLQKMIVESGSVTMDLDLNRLNGISSSPAAKTARLPYSCISQPRPIHSFSILVFNDLLRGPEAGSIALIQPKPSCLRFPRR